MKDKGGGEEDGKRKGREGVRRWRRGRQGGGEVRHEGGEGQG